MEVVVVSHFTPQQLQSGGLDGVFFVDSVVEHLQMCVTVQSIDNISQLYLS